MADHLDPSLKARALLLYGEQVFIVGEFDHGTEIYEKSLAEYRALEDEVGVADVLSQLVVAAATRRDFDGGRSLARQCLDLYRRLGDVRGEAFALDALSCLEGEAGNPELATQLATDSLERATEAGDDWGRSLALYRLCELAIARGDLSGGERQGREALELAHLIGSREPRVHLFALLARCAAERRLLHRAGLLWSAVESEERQGPLGQWESEREAYARPVLDHADEDFELGLRAGRKKTLDELVELAVHRE